MEEGCPLCEAKPITPRHYEDIVCWVADCKSHPDKKIVVLRRHTKKPTPVEDSILKAVAKMLFPEKEWRGPHSILDHFHYHEV